MKDNFLTKLYCFSHNDVNTPNNRTDIRLEILKKIDLRKINIDQRNDQLVFEVAPSLYQLFHRKIIL
jgi:hypothetical protein